MSGHSKWAKIKHKKGTTDAKRGAAFTKMIREITAAAKDGGGSLDSNSRLRAAIERAKGINMPLVNIENAVKKGTGELPGVVYETATFDAYGPGVLRYDGHEVRLPGPGGVCPAPQDLLTGRALAPAASRRFVRLNRN